MRFFTSCRLDSTNTSRISLPCDTQTSYQVPLTTLRSPRTSFARTAFMEHAVSKTCFARSVIFPFLLLSGLRTGRFRGLHYGAFLRPPKRNQQVLSLLA